MKNFISACQKKVPEFYRRLLPFSFFLSHERVILYFIFGSLAAVVDLTVYVLFFNIFEFSAVLSNTISQGLAIAVGFILNAIITFQVTDRYLLRFLSYVMVSLIGYIATTAMLYYFHTTIGHDGNLIKIVSLPLVFILQYTLNSIISFRKKSTS